METFGIKWEPRGRGLDTVLGMTCILHMDIIRAIPEPMHVAHEVGWPIPISLPIWGHMGHSLGVMDFLENGLTMHG